MNLEQVAYARFKETLQQNIELSDRAIRTLATHLVKQSDTSRACLEVYQVEVRLVALGLESKPYMAKYSVDDLVTWSRLITRSFAILCTLEGLWNKTFDQQMVVLRPESQ
jgi:hypothetical protein